MNSPAAARSIRGPDALFEYTGRTAMTVVGSWTGNRYRFDAPGARVAVHAADQAFIAAAVPNLRRVRR